MNSLITSLDVTTKGIDFWEEHNSAAELYCESCTQIICLNCIVSNQHNGHALKELKTLYTDFNKQIHQQKNQLKKGFMRSISKSISLDSVFEMISEENKIYRQELVEKTEAIFKQAVQEFESECKEGFNQSKTAIELICTSYGELNKNLNNKSAVEDHKTYQEMKPKVDQTQNGIQNNQNQLADVDNLNAPLNQYIQLHATVTFQPTAENILEILKEEHIAFADQGGLGFNIQFEEVEDKYLFTSSKKAVFLQFPNEYPAINFIDMKLINEGNQTEFYFHSASSKKEPEKKWCLFDSVKNSYINLLKPRSAKGKASANLCLTYESFMSELAQSSRQNTQIVFDLYKVNMDEIKNKEKEKFKSELITKIQNDM